MLIRKADIEDAPGIARVHVDSWRTTYRGILSGDFLASLSYDQRQRMWESAISSGRDVYVLDSEGQIVGFVCFGEAREEGSPYEGEIYAIYLLEAHHGQGWGKQLFRKVVERLSAGGMSSMMLWVLADNPTRGFYQVMGGAAYAEKEIEIGGQSLLEMAYGWANLEIFFSGSDN